jgi:putative redox protein
MKIEVIFEGNKKVSANINGIIVRTDQPVHAGGDGTAASPFELFLASLATCAGFYVKSFCDNRKIPTDKIRIFQEVIHDNSTNMVTRINIEIQVPPDFPENYKDALIAVANKCKVKKHLADPPQVETFVKVA